MSLATAKQKKLAADNKDGVKQVDSSGKDGGKKADSSGKDGGKKADSSNKDGGKQSANDIKFKVTGISGNTNATMQIQKKTTINTKQGGKDGKSNSIQLNLGTTEVPLAEASIVLDQFERLKKDDRFTHTTGFLTELFRKLQPLEKGQFTRLEIDMTVKQYQDYSEGFKYKMDAKPRGFALIICNEVFYKIPGDPLSQELPRRPGAEKDAENLETVLGSLGFRVVRKDNLKKWEMEHEIKTIARSDHKNYDIFLLIFSSHGSIGKLYGSDGQQLIISQQLKLFRPDVCKDLKGKPKLCFFQACPVADDDIAVVTEVQALDGAKPTTKGKKGSGPDEKPKFIINDVDFLVGYSTIPATVSYRVEQSASFYLNSLYNNLKDKGEAYDLVTILEDVNRELSVKKAKHRPGDVNAVSTYISCLRGPIFFQ